MEILTVQSEIDLTGLAHMSIETFTKRKLSDKIVRRGEILCKTLFSRGKLKTRAEKLSSEVSSNTGVIILRTIPLGSLPLRMITSI